MPPAVIENLIQTAHGEETARPLRFGEIGRATAGTIDGGLGRRAFVEITDPWDAASRMRAAIATRAAQEDALP